MGSCMSLFAMYMYENMSHQVKIHENRSKKNKQAKIWQKCEICEMWEKQENDNFNGILNECCAKVFFLHPKTQKNYIYLNEKSH